MVNFTIGSEDLTFFKGQGICLGGNGKAQRGRDDGLRRLPNRLRHRVRQLDPGDGTDAIPCDDFQYVNNNICLECPTGFTCDGVTGRP